MAVIVRTKGIASHVVVIINVIGLPKPSLWNIRKIMTRMDTDDGQEDEEGKLGGMFTFPGGIATTTVVEFRGSILYFFAHER